MKLLLSQGQAFKPPKIGEIVEGRVIAKKSAALYLDLGILGVGVVYGKEMKEAKEEIKKIKIGDTILAKIVDLENEDGYIELSIKGASKEIALEMMKQKKEAGEKIKVEISGFNKGGLLTQINNLPAFLPFSQLSSDHFPAMSEREEEKTLEELKKLVGQKMEVKILGFLDEQIILSEKLARLEEEKNNLQYQPGDVLEGEVFGITEYGVFVKIAENLEGLIPKEGENTHLEGLQIGEKVRVKVSSLSEGKIILSLHNL